MTARWMAWACLVVACVLGACADEDGRVLRATTPAVTVGPFPTVAPLPEKYAPRAWEVDALVPGLLTPTRVAPPSVVAAEAEGAVWVGGESLAPDSLQGFASEVVGTAEPRCVEVVAHGRVRSSGFVLDTARWRDGRPAVELVPATVAEAFTGTGRR